MTPDSQAPVVPPGGDVRCARHSRLDALLVRVGEGDRDAFAAFYDDAVASVHRMSLRGGHRDSLATALTFDVFLRVWLQASTYDPEVESAWSWLRAIARRTVPAPSRRQR